MVKLPISILINTLNEEKNIKACLESVKWANDIVLVDMHSEDKTIEIAKNYTNRIFFFQKCGYVEPAREFALNKAKNDWCLVIDADELVPYSMFLKITSIVENNLADVVWFPHNNYFFGALLKGTGWSPLQDMHPRLFKKQFMELSPAIHSIYKIKENAKMLYIKNKDEGFVHFNYIDAEHFLDKLNRYTTIEADNMFNGAKPQPNSLFKEIYYIARELGIRYVFKKGYKDGFIGLYLSILMGAYKATTYLKLRIMRLYSAVDSRKTILEKYKNITNDILKEYDNKK
jgi:glycosyltransferase involved in cell wall biosynthesis